MSELLKRPQFANGNHMADMNIRGGRIEPLLDDHRLFMRNRIFEPFFKFIGLNNLLGTPGNLRKLFFDNSLHYGTFQISEYNIYKRWLRASVNYHFP